ncbi:MAG: carboxylate--amine ligase [Acidobacteriia bacterium]|nr:carboxylate--amine ligase [Terriglobia bacterium]
MEFLRGVSRKIGLRPILTCTNDISSTFIAENAGSLRDAFLFPDISRELVYALCDKKQMYFLCKKHGIPTAETAFPQSRRDVLDFLESDAAHFPIMLKGIDGTALERRGQPRMVIVRNPQELLEQYDRIEDPAHPSLMLQEYIPGGDDSVWMFNGYFNANSDCLLGFAGQKIRQHPVYTGATSLGICRRNDVVEKTTKDFMKAIGYRGVLDIGHRYDARDGQYKILDINPRVGATFRLFLATNGMDVVRAMYLDLTGQKVPSAPPCEGRKWMVEDGDLISFHDYHRDGKLSFLEWLRSFRGVQETAWFAMDDLRPFEYMLGGLLRRFLTWFGGKLGLTKPARAGGPH